jgi:hypothetical protein
MGCFIRPDALNEEVIEAQKKGINSGYKIKKQKVVKLYEPDLFPKYL